MPGFKKFIQKLEKMNRKTENQGLLSDVKNKLALVPRCVISMVFLTGILCFLTSCKDKIYSFDVMPRTIGPYDSVTTSYKARGDVKLLIHDGTPRRTDTVSQFTRHYVLAFPGNTDTKSFQRIDVTVFPGKGVDVISFDTLKIHGDTLVSRAINDPIRWSGPFVVDAIMNTSGRTVSIVHDGKTSDVLAPGKTDALTFGGAAITGNWELRTLKTAPEKAGQATIPHFITLTITLRHKPYLYEH